MLFIVRHLMGIQNKCSAIGTWTLLRLVVLPFLLADLKRQAMRFTLCIASRSMKAFFDWEIRQHGGWMFLYAYRSEVCREYQESPDCSTKHDAADDWYRFERFYECPLLFFRAKNSESRCPSQFIEATLAKATWLICYCNVQSVAFCFIAAVARTYLQTRAFTRPRPCDLLRTCVVARVYLASPRKVDVCC